MRSIIQKRGGGGESDFLRLTHAPPTPLTTYRTFSLPHSLGRPTKAPSIFFFISHKHNIHYSLPLSFHFWELENVKKHKSLFRPPIKNYDSVAFTLTYLSAETRVNEAKLTDTTQVHKYEQQAIKVKYKSKGKEMQTQDTTTMCYRRGN